MKWIDGGVCAPKGFRASGFAAAIKATSKKLDCALIVSENAAAAAGVFTTNLFKAAPVLWCQKVCRRGRARAVFVNSGNANACTGQPGYENARATAALVSAGLGAAAEEILVCSTGVIGVPLPMERIAKGVAGCLPLLSDSGGGDAARAIMTTDTQPKEAALELTLSSGVVRLGAIAKGAGMIAPNMATMICVVTTDADIAAECLAILVRDAADDSFNRICVDNDMSTNDTLLCLANGASGTGRLTPASQDYDAFGDALSALCQKMAQWLVRDGEGATKFVEILVTGTESLEDARTVARSIAASQLCKTAFFGNDPNWGRIACAAGYAGVPFAPEQFNLWLDDVQLVKNGEVATYEEADAAACMKKREFRIRAEVGDGPGSALFWTSDLSHDYVTINADYRT